MAGEIKLLVAPSLLDLIQNPQKIQELIDALNLLLTLRAQMVPFGGTQGITSLVISGQNVILPLPIQLATPIVNPDATAAGCQAAIINLLNQLRTTKQLPS